MFNKNKTNYSTKQFKRKQRWQQKSRVVGYPTDHRIKEEKKIIKFIRNWLF